MPAKKTQLDATDLKIMELLKNDARISYQQLGESVGLTRPAVRERVAKLEENGVILGYHAELNPEAAGRGMHAMLAFKFNLDMDYAGKSPNETLIPFLKAHKTVVRYWETYGDLDYLIEAAAPTKEDLERFLEKLRGFGFVRTHLIMLCETTG